MRSALQFSFAVLTALVLNLIIAVPLSAQFKSPKSETPMKGVRNKFIEPLGVAATAANYVVAQTTGAVDPGTSLVTGYNCGSGSPGDDCIAPVTLPFAYTLYDTTFTSVNVSSNGNLQFASNQQPLPLEACLPIAAFSYVILVHHGDLTIGGANENIFTSTTGSAPNRIFNIEWRASLLGNQPGSLNFEVRLYEGQTRFDIVYGTVPGAGREATVGVQQANGATFTEFECFGSNALRNGLVLVFTGTSATSRFIGGRVTDPDGNPIAGAVVTLSGNSSSVVSTDGTGDYLFGGLTAGGSYTVTATQPGFEFYPNSRTFGGGGRAFSGNFIVNFVRTLSPNPGDILISEFRFRGQAFGAIDEFVELVNNTNQGITVNVTDGSPGWLARASRADGSAQLASFVVPNGTTIPAGGHYLAGNGNGYNLYSYSSADTFFDLGADVPDDGGFAIFKTANAASLDAAHLIDAVGFTGESNALYREGPGLISPGANNGNYSFVRKMTTGKPQDTGDNATDFSFVSTNGASYGGVQSILGAPGPESTSSPIQRNAQIKTALIDPPGGQTGPPNRVRDLTPVTNGPLGTLTIRRKFTNVTGVSVTRLRFRIVDFTTLGGITAGQADLRALNSTGGSVPPSLGGPPIIVRGLTVEQGSPVTISQPLGGGLNSSLVVGVITVAQPLAPNAAVNVEFRLGVAQSGSYRFFINIEALP
ncbi:MAG: carboxypeptidase regulatory-like domain-containing protein [bacterium]